MRWLVVGPYPPEQGVGSAAARDFVAERVAAGDMIHAVSPRPTAAHEHLALEGWRGIRAVWRLARAHRATGLWLRIEPGLLLRHNVDRRQAFLERAALARLLRRFDTSILDVGDVGLLPGGRAGRPVLAAATRFVARAQRDAEVLIANGAASAQVDRVGFEDVPEPQADAEGPAPDYPEPTALHDLTGSREVIQAAVRARAAELLAARGKTRSDGTRRLRAAARPPWARVVCRRA